jgi:hypothetical protein
VSPGLKPEGPGLKPEGPGLKPGAYGEGAKGNDEIASRHLLPGAIGDSDRMNRDAARVMGDLLSSGNSWETDLPFEEFVSENARTMQDLGNVYAGIEYMRFLEGEKHLVLVTEKGLFLPRAEDDERIAEAAATARVVIDTVQTGGLFIGWQPMPNGAPTPGQWSQFWSFVSLRTIAELTGGRSSVAAYARAAVDNIDATTRAGYLLGYYPKNMTWDGRYRKIKVKVNRPGVTVLYRHGYEATDQLVPFDRKAFLTFNRIISAALYPDEVRDVRVKARASLADSAAGSPARPEPVDGRTKLVQVDITIDADTVKFSLDEEKRHVARLDVSVLGADSRGRIVDERWQTIEMAFDDAQYEKCRRDGIRYSTTLAREKSLPRRSGAGDESGAKAGVPKRGDDTRQEIARVIEVKVIAYDYAADTLGSVVARIF